MDQKKLNSESNHSGGASASVLSSAISEPTGYHWGVGDWAIFDMRVVQIKEICEYGCEVSDGMFATSGRLLDRLRPLTLKNKSAAEYFDYYYDQLRKIDGEAEFNYPDISRYFSDLTLTAIDGDDAASEAAHKSARDFVSAAKNYEPRIQGVSLFRRNLNSVRGAST